MEDDTELAEGRRSAMKDLLSGISLPYFSFICNSIIPDPRLAISSLLHQNVIQSNAKLYLQSGSSAEGSAVPPSLTFKQNNGHIYFTEVIRSDIDLLCHFLPGYKVEITTNESPPGYCRLVDLKTGEYFLPIGYVQRDASDTHGPARTLEVADVSLDFVPAFVIKSWPSIAEEWCFRDRSASWPKLQTILEVVDNGYHIVAAENTVTQGESNLNRYIDWRFSFSAAENILLKSCNIIQRKCYVLLKMIKKVCLAECTFIKSYHLKNILLWSCEHIPADRWSHDQIGGRMVNLLDQLVLSLSTGVLPHYFIPQNNLFNNISRADLKEALTKVSRIRKDPISPLLQFTDKNIFLGGVVSKSYRELLAPVLQDIKADQVNDEVLQKVAQDLAYTEMEDFNIWVNFAALRVRNEEKEEISQCVNKCLREFHESESERTLADSVLKTVSGHSHVSDFIQKLFEDLSIMPDGAASNESLYWEAPKLLRTGKNQPMQSANVKEPLFVGYEFIDAVLSLISPVACCWEMLKLAGQTGTSHHLTFKHYSCVIPILSQILDTQFVKKEDFVTENATGAISLLESLLEAAAMLSMPHLRLCLEKTIQKLFDPSQTINIQSIQIQTGLDDAREWFTHWAIQPKFMPCLNRITNPNILGSNAQAIAVKYLESLNIYTGRKEERLFVYLKLVRNLLQPWDAIGSYLYIYTQHSGVDDPPFLLFQMMKALYGCSPSINTAAIGILQVVKQCWPHHALKDIIHSPALFIISKLQDCDVWKQMISSGAIKSKTHDTVNSVLEWDTENLPTVFSVILSPNSPLGGPFLLALHDHERLSTAFHSWRREGHGDQCIHVFCRFMNELFDEICSHRDYRWSMLERNEILMLIRYILAFFLFSLFPTLKQEVAIRKVVRIFIEQKDIPETLGPWNIIAAVVEYKVDPDPESFRICLKSRDLIIPDSMLYSKGFNELLGKCKMLPLFYEIEFQHGLLDIRESLQEYLMTRFPNDPDAICRVITEAYKARSPPLFEVTFEHIVSMLKCYKKILFHRSDKSAHICLSFPYGTSILGRQIITLLTRISRNISYAPQLIKLISSFAEATSTFFNGVPLSEDSTEKFLKAVNASSEVFKLQFLPSRPVPKEELILQYLRTNYEHFSLTHDNCNLCFDLTDTLVKLKHMFESLREGVRMIFNAILPGCHPYSQAWIFLLQNKTAFQVRSLPGILHSLQEVLQWPESNPKFPREGEDFSEFIIDCFPEKNPAEALREMLVERDTKGRKLPIVQDSFSDTLAELLGEVYPNMTKDQAASALTQSVNMRLESQGRETLYIPDGDEYEGLVLVIMRMKYLMFWHRDEYDHFQLYLWKKYPVEKTQSYKQLQQVVGVLRTFILEAYGASGAAQRVSYRLLLHELFPDISDEDEATRMLVSRLQEYFSIQTDTETCPSSSQMMSWLQEE